MNWKPEAIEAGIAEWLSDPSRSNEATIRAILDSAVKAQKEIYTREDMGAAVRLAKAQGRTEALEEAAKVALCFTAPGHIEARDYGEYIAEAIRALAKEPRNERT